MPVTLTLGKWRPEVKVIINYTASSGSAWSTRDLGEEIKREGRKILRDGGRGRDERRETTK